MRTALFGESVHNTAKTVKRMCYLGEDECIYLEAVLGEHCNDIILCQHYEMEDGTCGVKLVTAGNEDRAKAEVEQFSEFIAWLEWHGTYCMWFGQTMDPPLPWT